MGILFTEVLLTGCVTSLLGVLGWLALSIVKNTVAIVELTGNLKLIHEKLEDVPQLKERVRLLDEWRLRGGDGAKGKLTTQGTD